MEMHEYYADELRKVGLTEEQIAKVLKLLQQAALDAMHDSKVREWAWSIINLQI